MSKRDVIAKVVVKRASVVVKRSGPPPALPPLPVQRCEICSAEFTPRPWARYNRTQYTCSRECGSIRRDRTLKAKKAL